VVDPFFALDRFGVDVMRYYLAHDGGIMDDSDYGNKFIVERYKKGLQGGLGNLVSRLTRPKAWSVRKAVETAHAGQLWETNPNTIALRETAISLRQKVNASFDQLNPSAALHHIMDAVYEANKYITLESPWIHVKRDSPEDQAKVLQTIFHCAEVIRIVGILLQPYMPGKAKTLLDIMGVEDTKRTFVDTIFGSDGNYGSAIAPVGTGAWDALFPPLTLET